MTDDATTSRRRDVLRATATLGTASLAGCSWLSRDSAPADTEQETPTPTDTGTGTDGPDDEGGQQPDDEPLAGIEGYRVGSQYADSGTGTPDDPWVVGDDLVAEPGHVTLDAGVFATEGLTTAPDIDYEERSVYLEGAGVRTSTLQQAPSDDHLLSFQSDESGNFGGARSMALYGRYPDGAEGDGHLIHSNGAIFDLLFSNLLVRYGYGDGMRIETSASGTRIHNCWVENNGGWAINLGGGSRAKLSNLHIVTSEDGGINFRTSGSQLVNSSFYNCAPGLRMDGTDSAVANCYFTLPDGGVAIQEPAAGRSNSVTNVSIEETIVGVEAAAPESDYSNVGVHHATSEAMQLRGNDVTVDNLNAVDIGSSGTPALTITGDRVRVSGMSVVQKSEPFRGEDTLARITGDNVTLRDVHAGGQQWGVVVDGATETVLDGVRGLSPAKVQDGGTRTLVNGTGTNAGDPRSGGEWRGHADYAYSMGATVWDTTTQPWTPYRADGDGNWLAV